MSKPITWRSLWNGKTKERKTTLSSNRDVPILRFLWRWKLSTAAAITKRFFPDCTPHTAYKRILALRKGGYINCYTDRSGDDHFLGLGKNGFKVVRGSLPEGTEAGFRSEHMYHDLLVSAVHLGDCLLKDNPTIRTFTEQELRRLDKEFYPHWVPQRGSHRADGYWRVENEHRRKTIALEVERKFKTKAKYIDAAHFYHFNKNVDRVLWVVNTKRMAASIKKAIARAEIDKEDMHCFVTIPHFLKKGWEAKIIDGVEEGESIRELLGNIGGTCSELGPTLALLDTRKSPHKSRSYDFSNLSKFCY
jgi:hypothetical protein